MWHIFTVTQKYNFKKKDEINGWSKWISSSEWIDGRLLVRLRVSYAAYAEKLLDRLITYWTYFRKQVICSLISGLQK